MVKNMTFIAFGLIIIGILGMAFYKFDFASVNGGSSSIDKTWQFEPNGLNTLDVYGGSSNISVQFVESENDQTAYVQLKGKTSKEVVDNIEAIQISNKTLNLDMTSTEWHLFSFGFADTTLQVIVALPLQNMLDMINIDIRSGNGSFSNLKGSSIHINAGSGNIKLNDLVAQHLTILSGSGNIEGSRMIGDFEITSGSGDVTLNELSGHVLVDSSSGNVTIKQNTLAEADISARSGNVSFSAPKEFAGFYDLRTSSGNINAPDSKRLTQDVIKIHTGSGNIKVNEH